MGWEEAGWEWFSWVVLPPLGAVSLPLIARFLFAGLYWVQRGESLETHLSIMASFFKAKKRFLEGPFYSWDIHQLRKQTRCWIVPNIVCI